VEVPCAAAPKRSFKYETVWSVEATWYLKGRVKPRETLSASGYETVWSVKATCAAAPKRLFILREALATLSPLPHLSALSILLQPHISPFFAWLITTRSSSAHSCIVGSDAFTTLRAAPFSFLLHRHCPFRASHNVRRAPGLTGDFIFF